MNQKTTVAPVVRVGVFRYGVQLSKIASCPSVANEPFTSNNFRAVHADLGHPSNFRPIAINDPTRIATTKPGKLCSLWGLSMYENPQKLKEMILKVEKRSGNFRKLIGDHYVQLNLDATHGARTSSDSYEHFDFFEYDDCDHKSLVAIHQALFP